MRVNQLSVIFLPTQACNADCLYCFEEKSPYIMPFSNFRIMADMLAQYAEHNEVETLKFYWQGGEILVLDPDWIDRAHEKLVQVSEKHKIEIVNELQTNLIGYSEKWMKLIKGMFGGGIGSSLDYPNLYRRTVGGRIEDYNDLWISKFRLLKAAGIGVGVISLPNVKTLEIGAEEYYAYYFDHIGVNGLQVNSPFAGGVPNETKKEYPLDQVKYADFCIDLLNVWLERGYHKGLGIAPFGGVLDYFRTGSLGNLICGMRPSCSSEFISIDPYGNVSQCDCWVTSYPEYRFGNIFESGVDDIMSSPIRRSFHQRPMNVIQNEDCIDCEYLSICHGGCPIRAYTTYGSLNAKDPYCEANRRIYKFLKQAAVSLNFRET